MALKDNAFINQFGLTMKSCYFKIIDFTGNKDSMTIVVGVFPSQAVSSNFILDNEGKETTNKVQPVAIYTYPFVYDLNSTDNLYVQAYNYLKSLSDFENAKDC